MGVTVDLDKTNFSGGDFDEVWLQCFRESMGHEPVKIAGIYMFLRGITPIFWPPDAKNWLIIKGPDAGKDWRWEEKGLTEDEMVG